MNFKQRQEIIERFFKERTKLMFDKGGEYSKGKEDINFNFKDVAERLGLNPYQILMVYLEKAILSIEKWIYDGKLSSGETIHSRIKDALNYLDILESLIQENENKK